MLGVAKRAIQGHLELSRTAVLGDECNLTVEAVVGEQRPSFIGEWTPRDSSQQQHVDRLLLVGVQEVVLNRARCRPRSVRRLAT